MHDGEAAAPEDGGAVRDGQYACVDEACKGDGPRIARPQSSLRPDVCERQRVCGRRGAAPVLSVQFFSIQIIDGEARGGQLVEILHGARVSAGEVRLLARSLRRQSRMWQQRLVAIVAVVVVVDGYVIVVRLV